ncbi:MAG: hypothetical protein K5761_08230 [Clostridiales bacterium]|nr:hypothetical protein [Clostridiales bacterium]
MLKKFKKKSLKTKLAIIIGIILLLALIAYVLYTQLKPDPLTEYEMATVQKSTITDTLDVSGTVESESTYNYIGINGVRAEEVLVKVGDKVSKGDKIATFDVSGASAYLTTAKKAYDSALKDYNDVVSANAKTVSKKADLTAQINAKNKEIEAKKKEIADIESKIASQESVTEKASLSQEQIDAIADQMKKNGSSDEEIQAFRDSAAAASVNVSSSENTNLQTELIQKNLELSQLNAELTSLQAQSSAVIISDDDTITSALKNVADSKKKTYEGIKAVYDSLENGWYADADGIITVVNIQAGEVFVPVADSSEGTDLASLIGASIDLSSITSLLGGSDDTAMGVGVTLEDYNNLIATVSVGKSDLLKISTGMKATVLSQGEEYEGEIIYVAAEAGSSSQIDLSNLTSSLLSGSGSGSSALVKVKIKKPDKNIVIGFDVDIQIELSRLEDVIVVPVEAVVFDKGKYFVYTYNDSDQTVKKQSIEVGILDETNYEIKKGLREGQKVIKSPDPAMVDGDKVAEKTA